MFRLLQGWMGNVAKVAPSSQPPDSDSFAPLVWTAVPAGRDRSFVQCPTARVKALLAPDDVSVLRHCFGFASLDEHTQRIARRLGRRRSDVLSRLRRLQTAGLLVSAEVLKARCASRAPSLPSRLKLSTVGLVTQDRPAALERAASTFIAEALEIGRKPSLVVVDDSRNDQSRSATRSVVASLRLRHPSLKFSYAGAEEKRTFAQALATLSIAPPDVIESALFGAAPYQVTVGANRNALLLHTAGEAIFSADDDVFCPPVQAPEGSHRLAFSARTRPSSYWFFEDRESAMGLPAATGRLFHAHEQLLGRSISDCVAEISTVSPDHVCFEEADSQMVTRLFGADGQVMVTATGAAGDAGMASPSFLLRLRGASRARLLSSETSYARACVNRVVLRAVTCPTVCSAPSLLAMAVGLDNRAMLPPFMPVNRNEDAIFADLLRRVFADGYIGHVPLAVMHDPLEPRAHEQDAVWRDYGVLTAHQIIHMCLATPTSEPLHSSPEQQIVRLGRRLQDLGDLPAADFLEYIRQHWYRDMAGTTSDLDRLLRVHQEQPEYWARDARRAIERLEQALVSPDASVTIQEALGRGHPHSIGLDSMQRMVSDFGRLLQSWPAIVEGARMLRERGQRLAVTQ